MIIPQIKKSRFGRGIEAIRVPGLASLVEVDADIADKLNVAQIAESDVEYNINDHLSGTPDEIEVINNGDGTATVGIIDPLISGKGGTGLATITDHSVMLGSGTGAVTPTAVGATDDILTGNTGADPTFKTPTIQVNADLSFHTEAPSRTAETNWLGGLINLNMGDTLNSGAPLNLADKGIGKILLVVNDGGGDDMVGTITATGTSVDRNTGVETGGATSVMTLTGVTTDGSTTDSNGNTIHGFTKAYITDKWFAGVVQLTTTDVTLTDLDSYHISFHQYNDKPNIMVETLDCNLFTTGTAAEFDAYLYGVHVTGDEVAIDNDADIHLGADGRTAIASRYERLRRGNLAHAIDGTTDGVWVDIFYSNTPTQIEDVTMFLLAERTVSLTLT